MSEPLEVSVARLDERVEGLNGRVERMKTDSNEHFERLEGQLGSIRAWLVGLALSIAVGALGLAFSVLAATGKI